MTPESQTRKDQRNAGAATFQHRHFATIAAIIASVDDVADRAMIADLFAAELPRTNAKFDSARFYRACDVTPNQKTRLAPLTAALAGVKKSIASA